MLRRHDWMYLIAPPRTKRAAAGDEYVVPPCVTGPRLEEQEALTQVFGNPKGAHGFAGARPEQKKSRWSETQMQKLLERRRSAFQLRTSRIARFGRCFCCRSKLLTS